MKKPVHVSVSYLMIIMVFLSTLGCSAPTTLPARTSQISPFADTPKPVLTSTHPPSTPTSTPTPAPTPSRTPWPTPSPTSTFLPTPTLGPTMTNLELKEFLVTQLMLTGDCQLPCWWGSHPGQTPWEEAQDFFLAHGLLPTYFFDTYNVKWRIENGGEEISFGLTYLVNYRKNPRIIEAIRVGAGLSTKQRLVYNNPSYYKIFSSYALPALMTNFGKPSQVKVLTTQIAIETGEFPFYMTVEFSEQGVSVLYEGFAIVNGEQYLLCPHETFFSLYLWSPERSDPNLVSSGRNQLFLPWEFAPHYKDLEDASGISLDAFYDLFRNPQEQNCLATPIKNWPP